MKKLFIAILLCSIKSALFAQIIQSISPNLGYDGDNALEVTISGLGTNFSGASSTQVEFSQASTTYFIGYNTQIQSATQLTTYINIPCIANAGLYELSVTNGSTTLLKSEAFTVDSPTIQSVTPDSATQGDMLSVQITGLNSNFSQGSVTYVQIDQGSSNLIGSNIQVNNTTQFTASFSIPCSGNIGLYGVFVGLYNGCGVTLLNGFKVNPLIKINEPAPLCVGDSTPLALKGGETYTWTPSTGISATTGDSVIANPTVTTIYTVSTTTLNGCDPVIFDTVTINPLPVKPTIYVDGDTLISSSANNNQWYQNSSLIQDATNQIYIASQPGTYYVIVTNAGTGCSAESDAITTGINQLMTNNEQFAVYPNPTSGQFTIKLDNNQTNYTLEVYNVMGEKIYQSVLSNSQNTVNLSSQPAGMYFIYLKSDEVVEIGKVLVTK